MMKREILVEAVLAFIIILLIIAIREIRMVRSELKHSYITQPFPTVEITLMPSSIIPISIAPTSMQPNPTRKAYPIGLTGYPSEYPNCSNNKDCGGSWCTDAEPSSCYEEQCINGTCTTVQTSWHGMRQ